MKRQSLLIKTSLTLALGLSLLSLGMLGCGSSSSSQTQQDNSLSVNSLTALPEASELLTGSASAGLSRPSFSSALRSREVSGTPPSLSSINDENALDYFWNGLVQEINSGATVTQEMRQQFWEGENSCRMAQNLMEAFHDVEHSGTVLCYMKQVPFAAQGVTIESGDVTPSNIFNQAENDRWVKVHLANFSEAGEGDVFFRIYGSSSAEGSAGYAFNMYMCSQSTPTEMQEVRVNNATGAYTFRSMEQRQEEGGSHHTFSGVDGQLKQEGSEIVWDTAQDRLAQTSGEGEDSERSELRKNFVTISGDRVTNLHYGHYEDAFGDSLNKAKTISQFTGLGLGDVAFVQAGLALNMTMDSGSFSFTQYGDVEFQDSRYVFGESGDYFNLVDGYDFSDSFFSTLAFDSSLQAELSGFDCSHAADVVVNADFSFPELQSISNDCEDNLDDSQFCETDAIRQARNAIMVQ